MKRTARKRQGAGRRRAARLSPEPIEEELTRLKVEVQGLRMAHAHLAALSVLAGQLVREATAAAEVGRQLVKQNQARRAREL